jgi:quinoprotein glucose dehydrogenase
MKKYSRPIAAAAVVLLIYSFSTKPGQDNSGWAEYSGGPDRSHYSSLSQINTGNVSKLEKAWEYKSGDSGQVQCNAIIVNGTLFGLTASSRVFALDAATGKQKWRYVQPGAGMPTINRGVTYWEEGNDKRILYTYNTDLYALNAETGLPVTSFGDQGKVSLKTGLETGKKDNSVGSTTPGTIFEDLIIMPLTVGEGEGAAIGDIQAFNVKTGRLAWVFKTIPDKGEKGSETWPAGVRKSGETGAANCWAGMAVDRERGMIFIPTGSAAFDFYGGNRPGKNLFANCLIALNARTGKYIWHYQMVHHDIWDKDLPAAPNLLRVKHGGKLVDAVAQVTKNGFVFLFDRENGKPLFPVDEKQFPASALPGEKAWPTQPVPKLPAPFSRQRVTENDISHFAENRDELLETFRKANKGFYRPLDSTPSLVFPGGYGGAEWGGAAVDPDGILYINANEMPQLLGLSPVPKIPEQPGQPYKLSEDQKFLDRNGYPGITPPWGTLTAIDMNTGKHLWQKPLGEFKELTAKGIPQTGTENYGGPVVTAGGLLFIAATKDGMFRAFDRKTGKVLWETELPAAGFATPSTYEIKGRQYIVIACGGTKLGTKKGDSYVAFALNN